MKCFYDLHIHSALSPCGDIDMTPNNIANMAYIKGLDFIALTDHNSILNIQAILKCSESLPLEIIPGMEIESSEEVHVLTLFPTLDDAQNAYEEVKKNQLGIKNKPEIFGKQIIYDEYDQIKGVEEELLVNATKLSIKKIKEMVESYNGIAIPAHIDRNSYSVLSNLGNIPDIGFNTVEISKNAHFNEFSYLNLNIIRNSDAHYLEDISERENFIELEEKSILCLLNKINEKILKKL